MRKVGEEKGLRTKYVAMAKVFSEQMMGKNTFCSLNGVLNT